MDLQQHREIIRVWVMSCQTAEQLTLLVIIIDKFVNDRFREMYSTISNKGEKKERMIELEIVLGDLQDAITERNLVIAGGAKPEIPEKEKRPTGNRP